MLPHGAETGLLLRVTARRRLEVLLIYAVAPHAARPQARFLWRRQRVLTEVCSGFADMRTGCGTCGNAGRINLRSGAATGGRGGALVPSAGDGTSGRGGNITIRRAEATKAPVVVPILTRLGCFIFLWQRPRIHTQRGHAWRRVGSRFSTGTTSRGNSGELVFGTGAATGGRGGSIFAALVGGAYTCGGLAPWRGAPE